MPELIFPSLLKFTNLNKCGHSGCAQENDNISRPSMGEPSIFSQVPMFPHFSFNEIFKFLCLPDQIFIVQWPSNFHVEPVEPSSHTSWAATAPMRLVQAMRAKVTAF